MRGFEDRARLGERTEKLIERVPVIVGPPLRGVGTWRAYKQDRETGLIVEIRGGRNALTGAGKTKWWELVTGTSGNHYDNASVLKIKDSGGTLVRTLSGCASGYPTAASSRGVTWRWEDISIEEYEAYTLDVENSVGDRFSSATDPFGAGNRDKTNRYNWFFEYTFSFPNLGTQFEDDAASDLPGVDDMLDCFTGAETSHWDQGNANLGVKSTLGYSATSGDYTEVFCNAVTISSDQVTWEFVADTGTATGAWNNLVVRKKTGASSFVDLRQKDDAEGDKASDAKWTWRHKLTIS